MNKGKRIGRILLCLIVSFVMVFTLIPRMPSSFAYAELNEDGSPQHDKILTVNEDGTYTIALNVTGDSEKQIQKVNVIVIVDRSNSMDTQSGTGAYVPSNQNGTNMYGLVDGEYVQLTRTDNGYWANPRYTYTVTSTGESYTGQRYQYDATADRLQATKAAVDALADTLLGYNGKDGNPNDTVEMALVSFATQAQTPITSTTDASTYTAAVNNISTPGGQAGGTNWELALQAAANINFNNDGDPTYVIFFSDGAPTFYGTGPSGSGAEQEPNMSNSYNAATDDAATLAQKVGVKNFYTIFAYGSDAGKTYMTNLTEAAGAPAANNFSAANTAELNDAFAAILESIELAGIGAVSMEDGTTSSVTTTTGEISNLLTVDESSYKYYRAGGSYSDIEDYDPESGEYGAEWADAPEATFENGAVKWDLAEEGVLENDVTYTVTFDCWPSQTTLDIAADIKNDPDSYDDLDDNIKKYINSDGSLKTNTTASMSYVDTRTGESGSSEFENPDPVTTSAIEQLAVSKEWENALDGQKAEPITLTVTRDDDPHYTMRLGEKDPETGEAVWTDDIYISIGILRHTEDGTATDSAGAKYEVLEKGHNFTFEEPSDLGYYWELEVPTVRPMLIDGTLTMLILKENKAPYNNPENTTEYTIEGQTYYTGDTGAASLTAVNHRRARLNITKVVDGEDADPEQTFPFTVTVNDSKASEGSEDNLNSDYWVWFSVWNGDYVDCVTSDANKEYDEDTGEWTGYYYVPSGTAITLDLKAGDNLRFLNLPTETTYTIVEGTLPANYAFTSSELTTGVDEKFSGAQTTNGTIVETETDYTVTYTNTYGLADVEITKVWDDNDDQDGFRLSPNDFKAKLTLKADGTDVTSANSSKLTVEVDPENENNYIVKWTGLDRYADGEEIEYTVEEAAIDNYTTTGSPAEDHGTITNTHEPEVIDITVNKTWVGPEAEDGAEMTLKANGTKVEGEEITNPVTLSSSNNNTYTWEDLPKYADGEEIAYTVEETAIEGFTTTGPTGTGTEDDPFVYTNTNDETVDIYVKKVWVGPESTATINLLADGEAVEGKIVTLPNEGSNEYAFEGLRKYDATTGEEITYTVTENAVTGYTSEGPTGEGTADAPFQFTNTSDERTTVSVEKVWDDDNDRDGARPDSVTVHLKADGADVTQEGITAAQSLTENGDWAYTWENLYKYDQTTGEAITYTVTEDAVSGYTPKDGDPAGTGTANDPYVFTNSYAPGKTSVTVTKAWEDANDQDGIRPTSVEVTLLANDEEVTQSGITAAQTLSEDNNWTYTWTGLFEKAEGEEIEYTVVETETTVITGTDGVGTYAYEVTGNATEGFTVTNTHTPEVVTITVEKEWVGPEAEGGAEMTLKANGTAVSGEEITNPVTLSSSNNNTYTWEDLPKYADGEEIAYTVEETAIEGFTTTGPTGTGTEDDPFVYTNTNDETVDIYVKKVWVGPESTATINLLADGEAVEGKIVTLPNEGSNEYAFEGLRKYDATTGEEITYTVTENAVTGYTSEGPTGEGTADAPFQFTNTSDERTTVSVEKVWDDDNDRDGARPDSVTVHLKADGADVTQEGITAAQSLTENGDWAYTWENLYKYDQTTGEAITYTVTEDTVTGYTPKDGDPAGTGTEDDPYVFTNSYTPEVTSVSVTKAWDDADDQDGIRPTSVTVTLYANGEKTDTTVTLTEDEDWTKTLTGLDKYANGEEIEYTWVEEEANVPEGYEVSYGDEDATSAANGGTITNTHEPEQTEVSVKKVWDDEDNQDGIRPESITVKLLADGEDTGESVTLSEDNEWTDTIDELDKFAAGKEIVYTWDEGTIEDYRLSSTSEKDGLTTLTNTHTPEKVEVVVKKVWDDADNQDGIRPDSVTVKLLADGVDTGKTVELKAPDWTDSFTGLDKYKAGEVGQEINYTVEEVEVTDYEADVTGNAATASEEGVTAIGYLVTNTHEPELVTIPVEKVWDDADDQDGFRDTSITVSLLADGEDTGKTLVLQASDDPDTNWKGVFEDSDLYKYAVGKEGVPVEYTIAEPDVADGYKVAITGTVTDGFTVTNSHTPEETEVSVEKVWDDADDRDGIRPDSVTVTLLADGEEVDQEGITATVELNEGNGWKYTWEGLDKRAAGQVISYTVEEAEVKDYEPEISGDAENGYTIKNFHLADPVPVIIDPPVKKIVKGNPSKDETFTFQMKAVTEGAPMPAGAKDGVLTMDIVGAGEKEFGEAEITKAGTYVYEISEIDGKNENYKYDTTVYTLTVVVEEQADGTQVKLVKTETIEGGDGQIVFTNTYTEPPVKTGDTTIVMPYIVIGISALVLLIMLLFRTRKNRA